jgi:uncharacterized damage-inducible protein DinB
MSARTERLARRLEANAKALAEFAADLSPEQWQTPMPHDGRTIGVIVHHVASIYPLEVELAQQIAAGKPLQGVTWDAVATVNAGHAKENQSATKEAALALLAQNSAAAAAAIRALSDEDLDRAVQQSLYGDAELTCQFFLEDHAVRHAIHHLSKIRAALATPAKAGAGII